MKQIKKRILSGVIALSLAITDSSIAVFADNNNSDLTVSTTKNTEIEKSYITNELIDLRSEYSKTYEKSDGSRVSIVTASPLHYYDNNEKAWEEYDNTLSETKNEEGELQLTNNNPKFKVEIPKKLNETNSINAETKNYKISIIPLEVSESNTVSDNTKSTLRKAKKLKDKTIDDYVKESIKASTVEFEDIYPGTDTNLEYEVVNNSLKETITLTKAPEKETSYKFELIAEGLVAELKDDGTIVFKKNNENVFIIPAPFMTDSQYNYSDDIKTELIKNKDNYILSYTPSIEWLTDNERVYPVSVDPTITLNDTDNIDDTYVTSIYPDNNFGRSAHLVVGKIRGELSPADEYTNEYLSYIRFKELPENIWNNSYITNAVLNLNVFSAVTSNINAYEVTSAWNENSVTYKNIPTFKNEIIDYQSVSNDNKGYLGWDITNTVEKWYSNPNENYGIMLDSSGIYMYGSRIYASEYTGQNPAGNPYIAIEYSPMTNSGYENSRDIDIGRAGKVNINDFSGTLRLMRSDLSADGNIMPVNISMIYDENNLLLPESLKTDVYGKGFRTNYSQIISYNPEKEFYTYIGEDARPVYFEKNTDDQGNVIFTDYTEKGYELTVSGTSYENYSTVTLTDSSDHKYFFDNNGRLVKIADMNLSCVKETDVTSFSSEEINGIINISYSSNNSQAISSITDGVGRIYEFVYAEKLQRINYKGSNNETIKTVNYSYNTDGTLSSIVYPDNKSVSYNWSGNYIVKATNSDGYNFAFTYTDENLPRVKTIKEYSNDGTLGENISVSYSVNKTIYTDNKTDEKEILQFDKYGNLLTSQNAYGYTLVNQYGTSEGNTPSKAHNELINSFGYQKNEVNLLSNSRAQNGVSGWSGSTVSTDEKMFGSQSFKLCGKSASANQTVNLTGGQTYVLSAYVKTKNANGSMGASIKVNGGDITCHSDAQYITGTSKWTRIAATFKANSNCTAHVSLVLNSTNSLAEAYFDGIQLEKGTTVSDYSYIVNADFNNASNWNSDSIQSQSAPSINSQKGIYCFDDDETPFDSKCIKLFGDPRYENSVYQEITDLNGQKGDTYNLGGWAKANAAALRDNRKFGIKIEFFNNENLVGEAQNLTFNSYINDWQFNMASAVASDVYNKIKISAVYDYQVNYALFDRLLLQYDGISDIDEESSDEIGDEESSEDESSENQPITDVHGREIEYTDEDGVKTITTYDDYDNITRSATQINGKIMESINGYSTDGNYQISETNALGKTTVFDYDNQLGLLKKITDPKGNSVNYTYDSADNIATVSQGRLSNTYSYDNGDRLTGINSCGQNSYSFGYDKFGALNSIKLGSQSLVQYSYDNNYILSGINYGNGQSINYSYDKSGNKLGISSDDSEKYSYFYDDFGTLLSVKDNVNNTITSYSTDEDGIEYTQERKNNSLIHSYYNNGSSFVEYLNGSEKETEYASKEASSSDSQPLIDWSRTSWKKNGYNTFYNVKSTTDEFGRLLNQEIFEANLSDNKQTESGKNTLIRKSYEYTATNNGINQSEQVSKIKYEGTYDNEIVYTYDANGNIISDGKYEYSYDNLNRLQQTTDLSTNIHKHYTYNNEGNLVNVVTTKGPSTLSQIVRTYDGIKMVSYDGKAITYDDLGNPLTYYNGTQFTWEMGRQLASAQRSDGTQITYKYNAEGLRTEKKIGENSVLYTLTGSKITGQTDGTNTFYFRYDESDNLIGFELGSNQYFYITNLVGDIISIVDSEGNCIVEYEYDPWGVCTIVSDTSNNNLGTLNPFRYRGYYYDEETSLYYLQSRYYDPVTCKFINIDEPSIIATNPYNIMSVLAFDYCGGNPVAYIDHNGYKWITKLSQYKVSSQGQRYHYNTMKNNYATNKNLFNKYKKSYTYIYGQKYSGLTNMKYGNSKIGKVGCEIVATYNIMVMLKKKPDFAQMILEFELNGMYYFFSDFGTDPEDLYKYFDAHKVKYSKYTSRSKFYDKMGSGKNKCGIFSYWNNEIGSYKINFWNGGLHTMAYKYDSKTNKYYIYNYYSTSVSTKKMSKNEFNKDLKKHKFIIGYTF